MAYYPEEMDIGYISYYDLPLAPLQWQARPKLKIRFLSFSYRHPPLIDNVPVLVSVNCCDLTPPPRELCRRFTGLDPAIRDDFFSYPEHRDLVRELMHQIEE